VPECSLPLDATPENIEVIICLGDEGEDFWVGEKTAELGSSHGQQLKVLWYQRDGDSDMYIEELPDIVKPSVVLLHAAQLVPVKECEGRYRLRDEDKEAAFAALATRCLEGRSSNMADEVEGDDDEL